MATKDFKRPATQANADVDEAVAGATAAGSGVESGSATRGTQAASDARNMADIGIDEAWAVNVKRMVENALTLDSGYGSVSVESMSRKTKNAEDNDDERQKLANLALQHSIENSNQLAKIQLSERERTVRSTDDSRRHVDLAHDRQWNVDEQSHIVSEILRSNTFKDAISGSVATAVAAVLAGIPNDGE